MDHKEITVFQAKRNDQKIWDDFVLNRPDASPYHLFAWKLAIEASYGHPCYYLCAEKKGQLVGILPLVHIRFFGMVDELTALPFCDVGNCVCDTDEVQDALLTEARSVQKSLNCKKLNIRGPLRKTQLKNDTFITEETGKVRMLLNLASSSDELFSGFKSKLRSQVRKAEKNGVSFRWAELTDLDTIYSIFSKNMHTLGSPVHSKSWLRSILEHYKNRAKVGLAEFEGKAVGMGVILLGGHSVSIPWASTIREFNRLGPNMLLYWNFLKFSADNDYKIFDFGRSTEGEGTYRFKKQWGAKPTPLIWYTDANAGKDEPGHHPPNKRDTAADLWQKIPLPIANIVGPHLRKYISL